MKQQRTLAIAAHQHAALEQHLFPGDGLEAAAIIICGRAGADQERLCAHRIIHVPHDDCPERTPVKLVWPGEYLEKAIDAADGIGGSIFLIHSHPGGLFEFSGIDNSSDAVAIPVLRHGSADETIQHGSAIMVPGGAIKARLYDSNGKVHFVERIFRIGDDITAINSPAKTAPLPFSSQMTEALGEFTACVVGASGTGSIVIENLCRRGIGKIILIDFDVMKHKNLNRILNSTISDANEERYKTAMLEDAVTRYRPGIEIISVTEPIESKKAIVAASSADVIFSCVDTMEARHYCDLMSPAFIVPLIDVGVTIPTRQRGDENVRIADVCGRVDYVHPYSALLSDRGVVTPEGLYAEYLSRVDPDAFKRQLNEGYLKGLAEEAPSVLTLNMVGAALAVEEWMARVFPYRHDPNSEHNRLFFSLAGREFEYDKAEERPAAERDDLTGAGLSYPLLGLVHTENAERAAA